MASIRDITDKATNALESVQNASLQFIQEDESLGYKYRDVLSGGEFFSPNIIEGAIGNPPKTAENTDGEGRNLTTGEATSGGEYNGRPDQKARTYNVNPKVSGTGDNLKIEDDGKPVSPGKAVGSSFNRWSLFKTTNISGKGALDKSSLKNAMSKSLTGPADSNNRILNPTAKNIVEYAKEKAASAKVGEKVDETKASFTYDLADFIQCEHYGAISNNYLVTLRRFPYPVKDDIISPKTIDAAGEAVGANQPDIARALTYLSPELGNDIKSILNFKVGFNWKDVESQIQEITKSKGSRGDLGAGIDGSPLLSAIEAAANGRSAAEAALIRDKGAGWDPTKETYPNKVFGPYNVIKNILAREQGLVFEQDFTLTFHYDIRGYGNTSPKAAFMDTMSNLLALTYNNAPFWGGATRYLGSGSVGKPFGDFNKLASGDMEGFFGSLKDQFASGWSNLTDSLNTDGGVGDFFSSLGNSKLADNIVGGGLMKLLNGPQGSTLVNSFITGDPTGNWHLTIGNPMMPMMMIGNLTLQDAQFEFDGPLGYEDFPSKLKVTITLKPGRPRDKGEIESMFNAGRGRMYVQSDGYNPGSQEQITTPYGKQRSADDFDRRVSDLANG
jgi:hypothetical protein